MNACISRNPWAQMSCHTSPKEDTWVLQLAWRTHGVCIECSAEGGLGEGGGSICMGMRGRGECEVGRWVVVSPASGDPETLTGKKERLARSHGFVGNSMVDIETDLPGGKESIQESWEGGMVLREWTVELCPMGSLEG